MTSSADIGLLRFVRARTDETSVLNGGEGAPVVAAPELPGRLAAAALRLRTAAVSVDGRTVDYSRLAQFPAYAEYRTLARELAAFDPANLAGREERLAFWINVYNALSIEAVVAFGLRRSIREAPGFFRRAAYQIGGQRFSAEAIEHGILRGNRPPLPRLAPPLADDDSRLAVSISPPDPRVHFAINCATRACPPLHVYTAERLELQLDDAAEAFIRGGVTIEAGQVTVSSIFLFYPDDFGGPLGVADWISRYLDDPDEIRLVRDAFARGVEIYEPYDWTLNSLDEPAEERP